MISCYELRIGNYVLAQNRLRRIALLNNKASLPNQLPVALQDDPAENGTRQNFDTIDPVPMSDAVLQQCGFVYHDYFKFWQLLTETGDTRSEMDIDPDYNIIDFMRKPIVKKVSSLHQLQNIYFLLNEKELDFRPTA